MAVQVYMTIRRHASITTTPIVLPPSCAFLALYPQLQKAQQPQIVAGAFACIDLVCSAGFEERYVWSADKGGEERNTTLYK